MATLLFDKSKLNQDQEDLLVLLANANPEINIRDLIEIETVNGVLANAIQVITADWEKEPETMRGQARVDFLRARTQSKIDIGVERVVAKAEARGTIGAVTTPLKANGGLILSGTKIG